MLRSNLEGFCKFKGMRGRRYGRTHSATVSRRYTHSGACCESNALLWLRNMGRHP